MALSRGLNFCQQVSRSSRVSRNLISWFCTESKKVPQDSSPKCIFSGIQPTGIPHIGNYLGAIQSWVKMQANVNDTIILSIVDLHSITLPQDPPVLLQSIYDMVAVLIACGIDPQRTIVFQQSSISQHAELAWLLGCKTTLPRLGQFAQWKSKTSGDKSKACVGLYTYPVLQAADILLYKSTHVPVGDDQMPHLTLAKDLARIFNNNYGQYFPLPQPITGTYDRIKSLRDPSVKMSKSDSDALSRIQLTDSEDDIQKKCKKAVTDFISEVTFDPEKRPGVSNLISIHSAFSGLSVEEICKQAKGQETAEYKMVVAEAVNKIIAPIREHVFEVRRNKVFIQHVLSIGEEKARAMAAENFTEVKKLVGLCE
ncbi:tryptophan--tRNA ligase, mitochondrial-like [Amphiura filiformis]|uniref:tryptophan--tRNA ligase, mitochondrial-like n=1 Tax=Amphiura filiformis TaxID=82378 RepID=UPI003B21FDAE